MMNRREFTSRFLGVLGGIPLLPYQAKLIDEFENRVALVKPVVSDKTYPANLALARWVVDQVMEHPGVKIVVASANAQESAVFMNFCFGLLHGPELRDRRSKKYPNEVGRWDTHKHSSGVYYFERFKIGESRITVADLDGSKICGIRPDICVILEPRLIEREMLDCICRGFAYAGDGFQWDTACTVKDDVLVISRKMGPLARDGVSCHMHDLARILA